MTLKRSTVPAGQIRTALARPSALRRGSVLLLASLPLLLAAALTGHAQEHMGGTASPAAQAAVAADSASGAVPAVYRTPRAAAAHRTRSEPAGECRPAFGEVPGLSRQALAAGLAAVAGARARGVSGNGDLLTLIDYSLPSVEPRLWVLDLAHGKVLFHELVAHGAGSGDNYAKRFSNTMDSRQTSLGLFRTGSTYEGGNGYSLKLEGLDAGRNDHAEERKIVMHGAWYVSNDQARRYGRLGRSWGCPALPLDRARGVIDTIKDGTFVYSYAASLAGSAPASGTALARSSSAAGASCTAPAPAPAAAPVSAALR